MITKSIQELQEFVNKQMPSNNELKVFPFRTFFFYILEYLADIPSTLNVNKLMYSVFGTHDIDSVDFQELFGENFEGTSLVEFLQYLQDNPIGSSTTGNITSDVTVGGISAGQVVPAGSNLQQTLTLLLHKIFFPTFTSPSLTLTHNAANREIGETIDMVLTNNYNTGSILGSLVSGIWSPNTIQAARAGTITSSSIDGTTGTIKNFNNYVVKATETFNSVLQYAAGPQPKDSKNQDYLAPLPAGTLNSSTTIIGGLKRFAGSVANAIGSGAHVRTYLDSTSVLNTSMEFTFDTGTTNRRFVIAIPSNLTLASAINIGTNENLNFILTNITTVPDAAGNNQNYNVYLMENAIPFSQNYTIHVTLNA